MNAPTINLNTVPCTIVVLQISNRPRPKPNDTITILDTKPKPQRIESVPPWNKPFCGAVLINNQFRELSTLNYKQQQNPIKKQAAESKVTHHTQHGSNEHK